jgi:hypothetical protein
MNSEPQLIGVSVRHSNDEEWIDLECRFADGQKFTAVQVDAAYPHLAERVAKLLCVIADVEGDKTSVFKAACVTCWGYGRVHTNLGRPDACPDCHGTGKKP